MEGQYYPIHQPAVTQTIPAAMDPSMNVFLSETRTQNSEIRMGISKIADNVQKLLDKVKEEQFMGENYKIRTRQGFWLRDIIVFGHRGIICHSL